MDEGTGHQVNWAEQGNGVECDEEGNHVGAERRLSYDGVIAATLLFAPGAHPAR
jgi:hypothetical protein